MSESETLVDVCEEMRGHAKDGEFVSGYEVERLADRIEAAHGRSLAESGKALTGILRELLAVARNRMPSQPTVDELEVMATAEVALKEADNEKQR